MILIDLTKTELAGPAELLLSELTYAIFHVTNRIAEQHNVDVNQVENDVLDALKILRLAEAGMDIEEAGKIVKGDKNETDS